ncbi:class I SAM-dependent methyltransferase [Streptomyces sp. NBC_00201]|uniref:class I SAM-dependent methyltransferase n=1 Tax=unclassified Streptomyces TaxID=2593676 RepID=UPI00225BED32|nr:MULTISPECIES: class I SAM-dependent methyltransferase [unclassified Streptomyces]MCX5063736.1 class I SAM-dependent methyltransferase [Streptomyces sp. NBC_00452]MCX5251891.1 class I SAM-dependent methyltransferase [Streptomyces sp. NBC_00201]MCX5294206.1 class I SAM-dependent methyltransferase [Streptomyces sp. NBC_00183]
MWPSPSTTSPGTRTSSSPAPPYCPSPGEACKETAVDSAFDDLAPAYERTAQHMPFREHVEAHSLLAVIGDITGQAVLDLGCGSGLYTRRTKQLGAARAVGIDSSHGMLDHARRLEQQAPLGVTYLHRDVAHQGPDPMTDHAFDLVIAIHLTPYATTHDELTGICRTARRALRTNGGRFVAACLNPDFNTTPGWYHPYGFDLTCTSTAEGAPVTLHGHLPGQEFRLTGYYWSTHAHETALAAAGFDHTTWHRPTVSPQGSRLHGAPYWKPYLDFPHTLITESTVQPTPRPTGTEQQAGTETLGSGVSARTPPLG